MLNMTEMMQSPQELLLNFWLDQKPDFTLGQLETKLLGHETSGEIQFPEDPTALLLNTLERWRVELNDSPDKAQRKVQDLRRFHQIKILQLLYLISPIALDGAQKKILETCLASTDEEIRETAEMITYSVSAS